MEDGADGQQDVELAETALVQHVVDEDVGEVVGAQLLHLVLLLRQQVVVVQEVDLVRPVERLVDAAAGPGSSHD